MQLALLFNIIPPQRQQQPGQEEKMKDSVFIKIPSKRASKLKSIAVRVSKGYISRYCTIRWLKLCFQTFIMKPSIGERKQARQNGAKSRLFYKPY